MIVFTWESVPAVGACQNAPQRVTTPKLNKDLSVRPSSTEDWHVPTHTLGLTYAYVPGSVQVQSYVYDE